ncbi:hypothetical protein MHK_010541 [Candidatus Magnetomorum sp. HK-1]|nr:hypothetical protein MHK_010541 [Candidatus Magnetomorum sp. HK-1]
MFVYLQNIKKSNWAVKTLHAASLRPRKSIYERRLIHVNSDSRTNNSKTDRFFILY